MVTITKKEITKLVHDVEVDNEALIKLATKISEATKLTYPTVNDEIAAIVMILEPAQREAIKKAFKLGKKIEKHKSDAKDAVMYS